MSSPKRFFNRFLPLAVLSVALLSSVAHADVCSWKNPERNMARLFSQARDYSTVYKKVDPAVAARIEAALGSALDPSEKQEFSFHHITDSKSKRLGTVMALAGKGEYGAIEVVIGVDSAGKIVGTYIQSSRERGSQKLRAKDFLGQFTGKGPDDAFQLGKNIQPAPDLEEASGTVALTIKKMMLFYKNMVMEVSGEKN